MKRSMLVLVGSFVCVVFCAFPSLAENEGSLIIFHAGSLSIPLK
jgi:ABC-type molybdate transport system substrate-binding protein